MFIEAQFDVVSHTLVSELGRELGALGISFISLKKRHFVQQLAVEDARHVPIQRKPAGIDPRAKQTDLIHWQIFSLVIG